jgi:hypothetical protein
MNPLDRFVDEVRACNTMVADGFATIFRRLQSDPALIDLHDEIIEIVSRRAPLMERVADLFRLDE